MTGIYPSFIGFQHVLGKWEDKLSGSKVQQFCQPIETGRLRQCGPGKWNISWLERNDTVKAFGFDEHCLWQMFDRDGVKRSFYQPYFRINGKIEEESIADRFGPDVLADFMVDFMKREKDGRSSSYPDGAHSHIRVPGGPKTNSLPDHQQRGTECFPDD